MPIITSIKPQKNQKRFNIYLDGKFVLALSAEALTKAGLKIDQEISEEDIKRLRYKDIKEKLYNKVLRFLSYRPRSEKEIRDYSKKKSQETKIIEEIIKKLKKQGLVDDRAFATWWVEQRSRFRPKGRYLIRSELFKKGVKEEIISSSLFSEKEEIDLAKKAARKKIKSYKNLEPLEMRDKMVAFLARRGFNWKIIKKAIDETAKKR